MKHLRSNFFLFYFGTLLSSIGSYSLLICLAAFMIKDGYDLISLSLILGFQRLIPTLAVGLFGQLNDRFSPRLSLVVSEFLAAICSFGVIWAWDQGHSHYWFLFTFMVSRSLIVNFTMGSKNKISKLLSEDSFISNSKNAMWFNKVTSGATFFAGVVGWIIITKFDFKTAVYLDLVTFILNGLMLLGLNLKETQIAIRRASEGLFKKFRDLYQINPRAAAFDLVLAIAMMGTTSFQTRLAGSDQQWNAIFFAGYGLAVWVGGYIERKQILKNHSESLWLSLGLAYLSLGIFSEMGWLTFGLVLWKDVSYWLMFHRISSYIQQDTPQELMGAVTSARMVIMTIILSCGEVLVGSWQKALPIFWEGTFRGAFCFLVALSLIVKYSQREAISERPRL